MLSKILELTNLFKRNILISLKLSNGFDILDKQDFWFNNKNINKTNDY